MHLDHRIATIVCAFAFSPVAAALQAPEPDPPYAYGDFPDGPKKEEPPPSRSPTTLWTYHNTLDGAHPDGTEQRMLWHINRARQDPAAEGQWLAVVNDESGGISAARSYFAVNTSVLISEFATYAAKPPVAFDNRLYEAAKEHSDYLISIDGQSHDGQFTRVQNAGFKYSRVAGNVFSYAKNGLHAHAGFNIDWGSGTDGTQDPPGHRYTIMSVEYDYTNVGLAAVADNNDYNDVGPLVVTGNHASALDSYSDHYNQFLVGTVWEDLNGNSLYDAGEGVGGVQVIPDTGTYFAITSNAGGYAIPLPNGSYFVSFVKSSSDYKFENVTMNGESVLLDWQRGSGGINIAPSASFTATPAQGEAPLTVSVDASASSDSDGSIVSYAWDASNGQTASGQTASLTFTSSGSYSIELTVTDDDGASDSATKSISVQEASTGECDEVNGHVSITNLTYTGDSDCSAARTITAQNVTLGVNCDISPCFSPALPGETVNVTYSAGESITLLPEFTVNAGSTFHASISDGPRFTRDDSTGLITDSLNDQMWQDAYLQHDERTQAIAICDSLSYNGLTDWYLPNMAQSGDFHYYTNLSGLVPQQAFSWCTAEVVTDGYVRTKEGAEQYGGEPGDPINFSGGANVRCVRDM